MPRVRPGHGRVVRFAAIAAGVIPDMAKVDRGALTLELAASLMLARSSPPVGMGRNLAGVSGGALLGIRFPPRGGPVGGGKQLSWGASRLSG